MGAPPSPERPAARLLDLTRLVSRVGRGAWTGVDRVEAAWLARLIGEPLPLFGLVRSSLGFVLLDRAGVTALAARLTGAEPWGAPDRFSRLARGLTPERRAAESDLRRLALGRAHRRGLARLLAQYLPAETAWIVLGHANLDPRVFDAVHALPGGRAVVLLHDTIPLDHPEWQRPGTVERFAEKFGALARGADLVICNSAATRDGALRHFDSAGRRPETLVAPLGVDPPVPDAAALPPGLPPERPYFVALGTIEPRKNHALLLDLWDDFAETLAAAEIPALVIAGRRGWANEAVFARLDDSPLRGRVLFEHNALTDGAVAALVAGARALLMPSLAEGFGLPVGEALALGTRVIATDLPVYRELFGNNLIYPEDRGIYAWRKKIREISRADGTGRRSGQAAAGQLPTWQDHFNLVLKVT